MTDKGDNIVVIGDVIRKVPRKQGKLIIVGDLRDAEMGVSGTDPLTSKYNNPTIIDKQEG